MQPCTDLISPLCLHETSGQLDVSLYLKTNRNETMLDTTVLPPSQW